MNEGLITTIDGGIARMTIDRPEARNAMSAEIIQRMAAFVTNVESNRSIRVLLISGNGPHFMAGGDVKGMTDVLDLPSEERRTDFARRSVEAAPLWETLHRMPQPVVCKVRGYAAGAALSFVAGADLTLASDNAKFLLAHVGIGLVADGATTYHLPRAVGIRKAKQMAFFGDVIGAAEALEIGLVSRVVPDADLDAATETLVARLAAAPATSIANAKRLMNASLGSTLAAQIAMEGDAVGDCAASADLEEGVRAFIEKRPPNFGSPGSGVPA